MGRKLRGSRLVLTLNILHKAETYEFNKQPWQGLGKRRKPKGK